MTLILIRILVHISKILTVTLTQKNVFRTKHVYALSPSNVKECHPSKNLGEIGEETKLML